MTGITGEKVSAYTVPQEVLGFPADPLGRDQKSLATTVSAHKSKHQKAPKRDNAESTFRPAGAETGFCKPRRDFSEWANTCSEA